MTLRRTLNTVLATLLALLLCASACAEGFNATGYPVVDEPVTIHIAVKRDVNTDRKSLNDIEYLKEINERTGVHVIWDEYSSTEYAEKVNLMFVSGNIPDAFFGEGLNDLDILSNLDYFIPMNDLIDAYAPNIQACFEKEPNIRKVITAADGNIYSLFRVRQSYFPNTLNMMAINQKWLDALNLEMPTTTEEFYQVLKAFKEQDPNGNGLQDEIPLINMHQMGNTNISENWVFPCFGVYDNTSYSELTYHLMMEDGKTVFTPAAEGYKEALRYLNRLYSEGLLDQEIFTTTPDVVTAKLMDQNDIVGTFCAWTISNGVGFDRMDDFSQLLPLAGPDGEKGWSVVSDIEIGRNMFAITAKNAYPEATMRWIDEFYSLDTTIQTFYGPYGIMTEKKEDGTVIAHEPPAGLTYGTWRWGNTPADSACYACFKEIETFLTPAKQQYDRAVYQDAIAEWLQPDDKCYPNLSFTVDQIDELKTIIPDINTFVETKLAKFVTEGFTDAEWDEYVKQLNAMGLDKALEIWNAAYEIYSGA